MQFDEKNGGFEAICCQHCDEPVCVAACPSEAIVKDEETGWAKINPTKCIGCKTCVSVCRLSVPWFNADYHVSMKCDFCDGEPQCAMVCSPQAIRVATRKEAWSLTGKPTWRGQSDDRKRNNRTYATELGSALIDANTPSARRVSIEVKPVSLRKAVNALKKEYSTLCFITI